MKEEVKAHHNGKVTATVLLRRKIGRKRERERERNRKREREEKRSSSPEECEEATEAGAALAMSSSELRQA